ncbi:unnamed protein product [Nesidiocoris tenuis]|uniref:Uncharacterized protein n=1 Tax=Nesidiocoris tenuis TaxID=355587 RepID=A0A6H5HTB6_9HEMI|nr:unnamed protein product [Nesidiocoris tenuis]
MYHWRALFKTRKLQVVGTWSKTENGSRSTSTIRIRSGRNKDDSLKYEHLVQYKEVGTRGAGPQYTRRRGYTSTPGGPQYTRRGGYPSTPGGHQYTRRGGYPSTPGGPQYTRRGGYTSTPGGPQYTRRGGYPSTPAGPQYTRRRGYPSTPGCTCALPGYTRKKRECTRDVFPPWVHSRCRLIGYKHELNQTNLF